MMSDFCKLTYFLKSDMDISYFELRKTLVRISLKYFYTHCYYKIHISAGIGERYQTEEQEVDRDFISNLFGTNNKPPYEIVEPDVETNLVEEQCHDPNKPTEDHSPSITVDDEARNCLEYADQGFR